MTSTDALRKMLDELWVEHWDGAETTAWGGDGNDYWYRFDAREALDGTLNLHMHHLTPSQAIEATLGRGTCHITVQDNLAETDGMGDVWLECDACHWQMPLEPSTPRFNFCPNCGRKVEQCQTKNS